VSTLLRAATVVDGTGRPGFAADVLVEGGRIADVRRDRSAGGGGRVIDCDGLVLAPGFIDMHAHSDLQLLAQPDHLAKVSQGVTCEVIGQDGLSYAPVDDGTLASIRRQIAGWNDDPPGFDWNWHTVGEYLDRLDAGIAVNAAYLVPQGTVRQLVVGFDDRPATAAEVQRMCELVAQSMRAGAVGLSTGLTYPPGMYASDDELAALLQITGALGGYLSTHHRSYGVGAIEAYAQMIELAARSGCPLHLTHATLNFSVNRGRAPELVSLLDRALAAGQDVTIDSYPYLPGATTLAALLPSWAAAGGPDACLDRLADPAARERIRVDLEEVGSDGWHGVRAEWDTVVLSGVAEPALAPLVGRTVAQLAEQRGLAAAEVFFDLLQADRLRSSILQLIGNEENVRTLLRHRTHCGGSDGILVGARPHPRSWGTFPRYFARYVRELGLLTLEDCVHHLTGRPARRLKLRDRGVIAAGAVADLVLFDPASIADRADLEHPRTPATGIAYVFVGGVATLADGRPTGALPGRALRRAPDGRSVG
jgi:N-acyl-D-amino-acid deacylase